MDDGASTLRDYLHILRRGKWLIVQALILVPIVAVVWEQRRETVYRASAGVLMNTQNLAANLEGVMDPSQTNPSRIVKTQVELARVPEVARRTIQAAGLENWVPSDFLATSNVTSTDDTDILRFSVTAADRGLAIRLTTEYARQFTLYRLELDTAAIQSARDAVNDRIKGLEASGEQPSALYASLLENEQRLATLQSLQTSRAVLVEPATEAVALGPEPEKQAVFGIALGLLLGLGLAFLRDALDTTVHSTDLVARELRLTLLGRIPEPPRKLRRERALVTLAEPHGPHAEAFRMLMSNIELKNRESDARIVLITSAIEREGKSTTAANLAVVLARAGKRVVLVDFDAHGPGLHHFVDRLPLHNKAGLSEVLRDEAPLSSVLSEVDVSLGSSWISSSNGREPNRPAGRLELLPPGAAPSGPTNVVVPLGDVLDRLRQRSDIVLLDAPPLLRIADAVAAASHVDALLLVVRLGVVRKPMLGDLRRVLASYPSDKLGFVATGANAESGYGYLSYPYLQKKKASVA